MLHFLLELLFILLLVLAAVCDIRTLLIPDRLNAAIFVLGICRRAALLPAALAAGEGVCSAPDVLLTAGMAAAGGLLTAALPMYLLAIAFPGSLGGGDIKLTAAAGVFLGVPAVLRGTAYGMVMAGLYAAAVLLLHKKTARQSFALGPFLAAGFIVVCPGSA